MANHGSQSIFGNVVGLSLYLDLKQAQPKFLLTFVVPIEEKNTLSLISHVLQNLVLNGMKPWKKSRMDLSLTQDTTGNAVTYVVSSSSYSLI